MQTTRIRKLPTNSLSTLWRTTKLRVWCWLWPTRNSALRGGVSAVHAVRHRHHHHRQQCRHHRREKPHTIHNTPYSRHCAVDRVQSMPPSDDQRSSVPPTPCTTASPEPVYVAFLILVLIVVVALPTTVVAPPPCDWVETSLAICHSDATCRNRWFLSAGTLSRDETVRFRHLIRAWARRDVDLDGTFATLRDSLACATPSTDPLAEAWLRMLGLARLCPDNEVPDADTGQCVCRGDRICWTLRIWDSIYDTTVLGLAAVTVAVVVAVVAPLLLRSMRRGHDVVRAAYRKPVAKVEPNTRDDSLVVLLDDGDDNDPVDRSQQVVRAALSGVRLRL